MLPPAVITMNFKVYWWWGELMWILKTKNLVIGRPFTGLQQEVFHLNPLLLHLYSSLLILIFHSSSESFIPHLNPSFIILILHSHLNPSPLIWILHFSSESFTAHLNPSLFRNSTSSLHQGMQAASSSFSSSTQTQRQECQEDGLLLIVRQKVESSTLYKHCLKMEHQYV